MTKQLEALKAKPKLKVWMDCGNEEGGDMLVSAMNAASIMKKKGWGAKDLRFYVDGHAQHNERAWAGRLPMIFEWFFGR